MTILLITQIKQGSLYMQKKNYFTILSVMGILGIICYALFILLKDLDGPIMSLSPDISTISPTTELTLNIEDASKIRSLVIIASKTSNTKVIFNKVFKDLEPTQTVTFNFSKADFKDGVLNLRVKATDASFAGFGQGNTRTRDWTMHLDSVPPRISIISTPPYIRQGGTGVVQYKINEKATSSGVMVNSLFFKGYKQSDGTYHCFFAFPHNLTKKDFHPKIIAKDIANNETTNRLPVYPIARRFKTDKIQISDAFLDIITERLYDLAPEATTPLERYITINKDIRADDVQFLYEIGSNSHETALWSGNFMSLPRSALRAGFAENRTYIYKDQVIDRQVHQGFDLASTRNAKVPVANNGRIVFVGNKGIYGKLIIVDHGVGLMTLYSHLSEYNVAVGDELKKGDIIGRTGMTGLALGDHLHFGVMIGGIEVMPLEWLDGKWIVDNITGRLSK